MIERRLRAAAEEIRNYDQYDYVLVNDDLEKSDETLAAIVRAERVRRTRVEEQIRPDSGIVRRSTSHSGNYG